MPFDQRAYQREYMRQYRAARPELRERERQRRRDYGRKPEARALAAKTARRYRRANPTLARAYQWRKKGALTSERAYADILLRDPCSYCGSTAGEIDHIVPVSKGGQSEWHNLTASCGQCNKRKKNRRLVLWMARSNNGG